MTTHTALHACSLHAQFLPSVRSSQQSVRDAARVTDAVESTHETEKYCKRNLRTGHRAAIHRRTGHRAAVHLSAWRYLGATANSSSLHSQIPVVLCASNSISRGRSATKAPGLTHRRREVLALVGFFVTRPDTPTTRSVPPRRALEAECEAPAGAALELLGGGCAARWRCS